MLTAWPMTDALREPFFGWVARPYRAVDIQYVIPGESPPAVDAVIAFEGLASFATLVRVARARGFRLARREQVGGAAIELWER